MLLGAASFSLNAASGNYWGAALDAGTIIVDGVATALPGVPAGLSSATASSKTSRIARAMQNRVQNHMKALDLVGAVSDILGSAVTMKGKTYQHLKEVTDALAGMKTDIVQLKALLKDPKVDLSKKQRKAVEAMLSEASKHTDRVEGLLGIAEKAAEKAKDAMDFVSGK